MDNRISVAVKAVIQSGVSISEAYIDEAGHLVLVLSNKDSTDLGLVTDKESASAAHAAAEEALAVAAAAEKKVDEVYDVAAEAKGTADDVYGVAVQAKNEAESARNFANSAVGIAEAADEKADSVKGIADEAKDMAISANKKANSAKSEAESATTVATEAKTIANEAKELANDMQVDLYDSVAALRTGEDAVDFSHMTASGPFRVLKGTAGLPDANNAYLVGQWCYAYESGANRYIRFAANISGSDSSNFALYYSADGGTPSWHKMT